MKRTFFAVTFFLMIQTLATAQSEFLERQKEKAKNKVSNRVENKIDEGMDKALDKTEEGIEESVKRDGKKDKEKKKKGSGSSESSTSEEHTPISEGSENASSSGAAAQARPLKVNSKFDFVAGERITGYEDFSSTKVGDFPINWNTNASGEVVTIDGYEGQFLKLGQEGVYYPDDLQSLPENFTLEMDMLVTEDFSPNGRGLRIFLTDIEGSPTMFNPDWDSRAKFSADIHPLGGNAGYCTYFVYDNQENLTIDNKQDIQVTTGKLIHISIWRQKTRVRLYVDDQKVIDLPRALYPNIAYQLIFADYIWEGELFIGNLRLAEGAPDTRSKLITEGKLTSRGIFFDANSDRIKPESYGALKEIANVLEVHPDVNIQIVGHTDSDGDEVSNLELSKRRAEAVKKMLSSEFGIAEGRLSTDGKGETQPTDPNTTPAGKANNRRVEFIKQ